MIKIRQRWRRDHRHTRILRPEVRDEKSLSARRWRSACRGIRVRRGECAICLAGGSLSGDLLRRTGGGMDQSAEPKGYGDDVCSFQSRHCRWRLRRSLPRWRLRPQVPSATRTSRSRSRSRTSPAAARNHRASRSRTEGYSAGGLPPGPLGWTTTAGIQPSGMRISARPVRRCHGPGHQRRGAGLIVPAQAGGLGRDDESQNPLWRWVKTPPTAVASTGME